MTVRYVLVLTVAVGLGVATASAQPTGAHPRAFLTPAVQAAWAASADVPGSAVARAIATCEDAIASPADYRDGGYQGFTWVETLGPCLVAWKARGDARYRDAALVYFRGLLDDEVVLGDGAGPAYAGGLGIVARDTGYSMRTNGVYAALGYDWLHDELTATERDRAHTRFTQWLAFHFRADTYMRDTPGANYHAGHVLAVTLIAIGHGDEMNARDPGTGTALYRYVVSDMWGSVMSGGYATRGPLRGGDWLEGWQYGALSVANYALAARALVEQGENLPFFDDFLGDVVLRFVHGLTPLDRMFVGGDTGADTPSLDLNDLPLVAAMVGPVDATVKGWARAERDRLGLPLPRDFRLFFACLAEAETAPALPLDRSSLPLGFLAEGTGNFYQRTAHDPSAVQVVHQCRGILVDHQHEDAGNLVLTRGADELLVDPSPYGSLSTLTSNAPTMRQPHFNATYQPGQGPFGESYGALVPASQATRLAFARTTASGVHASRCDYTGQFRFRDVPSPILDAALRDVVLMPGSVGASVLVVDRVDTTAAHTDEDLLLRFRSQQTFAGVVADRSTATGGSTLRIRRLVGAGVETIEPNPVGDCAGDRGNCRHARFASEELRVDVGGDDPFVVHLLDADAAGAPQVSATVASDGTSRVLDVHRETRRFVAVLRPDGSPTTAYVAEDGPSTHVVLDPPPGSRVAVTATQVGSTCRFDLAPATGTDGFASPPLVFGAGAACIVVADDSVPPIDPPDFDAGMPDAGGPGPGSRSGGCGCRLASTSSPFPAAAWAFFAFLGVRRGRRSTLGTNSSREGGKAATDVS